MASEARHAREFWKICHFSYKKYEQIANLEHFFCPGGGAQTHLCPPSSESAGTHAPFSYAMGSPVHCVFMSVIDFHCRGPLPLQLVTR